MKINTLENGVVVVRDMTAEELEQYETQTIPFKERVIARVREVYSVDDELAILRQRDSKPEEFDEYNAFVEKIKAEEREG